ncbi:MBOAT family protein [bacterium]|nr:MBOAT family protein [bacterium]
MFFNSFVFFMFLGLVLPVYFLLRNQRSKALWLLAASYFFYGYWDWRFCSLLLLSTVVDFIIGKKVFQSEDPVTRKRLLWVSMAVNLGILGFFKYFNFFIGSVEAVSASLGLQVDSLHLNIILPVGISFYTFQTMSYTIDIYRRRLEPTDSLIDFALFVAFFPQLVAGPIERARNLLPQIAKLGNPGRAQVGSGLALMANGFFRKVLIGDTAGRIVDQVFSDPERYYSPELLAALVLFSIQIYADFSGYSHIARGLARLLGVDLMRNFEQPYLSANITEFWRRWHISLSSWLRDYLYITLGGNRLGNGRTYVNLMLTMLLGGLWHGANWTFVVWGGLHGIYLAVHKLYLGDRKIPDHFTYAGPVSLVRYLVAMGLTNLLVLLTWLFFRARDFGQAGYFLDRFIHWEGSDLTTRWTSITVAFLVVILALDIIEYRTGRHDYLASTVNRPLAWGIGMAVACGVFLYMATSTPLPFVYFQF